MTGDTIAAEAEPLTGAAQSKSAERVPPHLAYEMAVTNWTRVTRSFVRSLQAYKDVSRARVRRRERSSHEAVVGTLEPVAEPSAEPLSSTGKTRPLTSRQFEIAELIALGMSNEEIAQRLVLTPGTVGNHVGHILRRLSARNRAQVATWVTQLAGRGGANSTP
jgi:DNA-binding NarL/FixJ family response regulator